MWQSIARRSLSLFVLGLALALTSSPARAFSPYENYLLSGRPTHVGLIAQAVPGREDALTTALLELETGEVSAQLAKSGITEVTSFSKEIQDARWFVVYFTFDGSREYQTAAQAFEAASPKTATLADMIVPHPRAERYGTKWTQMEWINFIRGRNVEREATSKLMIVTTIIPEQEFKYRTLHQTVWPGVVDQVVRGNIRNLNVFLIEMGDQLVEYLYLEYVGEDQAADDEMNNSDPVNLRWWDQTNPCQLGISGEGNWVLMDPTASELAE